MRAMHSNVFLLGGLTAVVLLGSCGRPPTGPREGTADIFGSFKDQAGVGVPGVKVRIINTTIIQDAVSDTAGNFSLVEVTPGTYDFNIYTPANYRLAAGQPASAPISAIEGQTLRPEITLVQSPGTPAAPGVAYVEMYSNFYRPGTLRIKTGTTVTWQNLEPVQHTVASELNNEIRSGPMSRNQRFLFTFNTPGSYLYHCLFHAEMFGTVIVE
jgi:plastocyanin